MSFIIDLIGDIIDALVSRGSNKTKQRPSHKLRPADGSGAPDEVVLPDYDGCPPMAFDRELPGGFVSGQVVWAWVAYEEDPSQGKDRPVLLVAAETDRLLGLPATSKDHDRDAAQERRAGRYWVEIGTGDWDARRRISEVRADRIVRLDPNRIRRVGGRVSQTVFTRVAQAVGVHWSH